VRWDIPGGTAHDPRAGSVSATFDGKELVGLYQFGEGNAQERGTVHLVLDGGRLEGSFASLDPPGRILRTAMARQPPEAPAKP